MLSGLTSISTKASDYPGLQLARIFGNRVSAKAVGREYLRLMPMEADIDLLIQRIFSRDPDEQYRYVEMKPFREMISARILSDFERDRVLAVHGWILSQTELRLCAIAALV